MKISFVELSDLKIGSIGVRSLSAYLRRYGHRTQLIFMAEARFPCEDYVLEELVELCKNSDLIGLSFLSVNYEAAVQLTRNLKDNLKVPVIWGGVHATSLPEDSLQYCDIVCRGEGEEALQDLMERMEENRDYFQTENFWFKRNGRIIRNRLRPLIGDLDSLPFLDHSLSDHYLYSHRKKKVIPLNKDVFKEVVFETTVSNIVNRFVYHIMTMRGCPYACTFCFHSTYKEIYGNQGYLRKRSIDNVIQELKQIKERFHFIDLIFFSDDCFFARSEHEIDEFSEKYKEAINLPFFCLGSPQSINERKLERLIHAGLWVLQVGIQTGARKTAEIFNRTHTNEKVLKTAKIINKFRGRIPPPNYDFILDNYWETIEDQLETMELVLHLPKPFNLYLASLRLYPGSALFKNELGISADANEVQKDWRQNFLDLGPTYLNLLLLLYARLPLPKPFMHFLLRPGLIKLLNNEKLQPFYSGCLKLFRTVDSVKRK